MGGEAAATLIACEGPGNLSALVEEDGRVEANGGDIWGGRGFDMFVAEFNAGDGEATTGAGGTTENC